MARTLKHHNVDDEPWYQDISKPFTLNSDVQKLLDKPQDCVKKIEQKSTKAEEIEKSLIMYGLKNLTCELIKGIKVGNQTLGDYFANLDELGAVIDLLRSINGVATDVIGILCLIASTKDSLHDVLQGKDVEKSWKNLIKKKKQVTKKAKESYAQHKDKYQRIFNCICTMIGKANPQAELCIRIAAFLFTLIWPQRGYLASWIDSLKLTSGTADGGIVPRVRDIAPDNIGLYVVATLVVAVLVGMLSKRLTY